MSSAEPKPTASFNYNVRWMSRTFATRTQVESLLGPEHAAGNINTHDYHAAIAFLPGFHRFYGLLMSSAAISAIYILRKPSWSQMRTLSLAAGGTLSSLAIGNALTLKSHYDFVSSLNNPGSFSKAVDRIQKQSGIPPPNSPIIQRKYNVEEELHGNTEVRQDLVPPEPAEEPPLQSSQPQGPSSRWDQIRAVNAATTASSFWDVLRQKHEKPRVQKPGIATSQNVNEQEDDRAAEQARFDALLEKERNFGSRNTRE